MASLIDDLEKLESLRISGAIDAVEFEILKESILEKNTLNDYEIREPALNEEYSNHAEHLVTKTIITDNDEKIANSLRGKRRFSCLSIISIIFLFVTFAIMYDFFGYEFGYVSVIICVILIIALEQFVDFVYQHVPIIAIVFVSFVFSFIMFSLFNFIFDELSGYVAGFGAFLYAMIHSYRGSIYYAERTTET